ncbi:hypothetical protein JHK85_001614 [Glycine max]|nr:hypothetical protein JHK85_001614 [Glycine max]
MLIFASWIQDLDLVVMSLDLVVMITRTDDDLPPTHQNRISRGGRGHLAGNERYVVGSIPYPRMYSEIDRETQIHLLEQEAYSSVLRAFKAQADAITWEKESLITRLRKELRLSNEEHRELPGRVNVDVVVQRIRSDKIVKQGFLLVYLYFQNEFVMTFH